MDFFKGIYSRVVDGIIDLVLPDCAVNEDKVKLKNLFSAISVKVHALRLACAGVISVLAKLVMIRNVLYQLASANAIKTQKI